MSGVIDLKVDGDGIAWVKMNDKKNKNIFSEQFIEDFLKTMNDLDNLSETPKVMVLQGLHDVFCAGADKDTLIALTEGRVVVKDLVRHPMYGKYVQKQNKLTVHAASGSASVGDIVEITPCRKISKTKSWRMIRVVRAGQSEQ